MINRIQIDFQIPVELNDRDMRALNALVTRICDGNCPSGWVFWPAGFGALPNFSKTDAAFLGKETDQDAPATGEPTFDETVYAIDCVARDAYPEEISRRRVREAHRAWRALPWWQRWFTEDPIKMVRGGFAK